MVTLERAAHLYLLKGLGLKLNTYEKAELEEYENQIKRGISR